MAVKPKSARGTEILRGHLKHRKVSESVVLCIALLQTGQISGPFECAVATTRLLGAIISNFSEKQPVSKLLERVHEVGAQLIEARPSELTIGNMLRRVLGLIKECSQDQSAEEPPKFDIGAYMTTAASQLQESTFVKKDGISFDSLPTAPSSAISGVSTDKLVRDIILDAVSGIDEILDELESTPELTAAYSPSYIFPTDVVLIQGYSSLSHRFLAQATSISPGFVVFAVDNGSGNTLPDTLSLALSGKTSIEENEASKEEEEEDEEQELAKPLAKLNVSVTILPQSAVFSIMPQITKVLIAPNAVLPDGSVIAPSGTASIVLAAKAFSVPVLSLSGTYHFCPVASKDTFSAGEIVGNTGYAVGLEEGSGDGEEDAEPKEPADGAYYTSGSIGSDGIDLYVTNVGVCGKSGLPKIMSEQYDAEFVNLSRK